VSEYKIPEDEQDNVMNSFWTMLRECETSAENSDDLILKRWVEQWYQQFSRISGLEFKPSWLQSNRSSS